MKIIKGTPVSLGIAKGKIKIINSEKDREKLEEGDIILTTQGKLDINMLKTAAAVISPTGGLTNHLAKRCREMGKACILAVENSELLKEGDEVEVNADIGEIRIDD